MSDLLTITDAARDHFLAQIAKRADGWGILIGTRTAGCSGLSYVVEFWDGAQCNQNNFDSDERPHHINGVPIVMHPKDEVYLKGMVVDYVKEGLNEGLKFTNPNSTGNCGCGETFSV